jgi:hypothetical protein
MEIIARSELALAQVSGGASKDSTNSNTNTSTSNSVVVISQGGSTTTPNISLPSLSIS